VILTLTQCIGGLGIFFAGMYLLTENLRLLTGRRFREAVARFTRSRPAAVAWGVSAGAVMQSTPAVTLITVSMLGSGLIAVETGLAMVLGCNVGTSLLVVVASLDIKILVYVLLGFAGLSFVSTRLAAARTVPLIVFGIGLVFLGLDLLKDAVGPIAQQPWLRELLASSGSSMPLLFLVGIVLSVLTQSANSIMLLAIALADAGALSFNQAVITIYGANVGGKGAFRVHALSANPSVLTCLGNDTGYENVFAKQLEALAQAGDLLLVFSGSGNSPNILRALEAARKLKMLTISFLGFDGGKAKSMSDLALHFAVHDMQVAEDLHMIAGHLMLKASQ